MKKIVLLASLTLIFASCGRSNDNTNEIIVDPPKEVLTLPTKVSGSYGVRTIKYDGNKFYEIMMSDLKMVFEYTGDLITKITSYDSKGIKIQTVDLVYSNGKLTNVSSHEGNDKYTYVFSYPDANTINTTKIRNNGTSLYRDEESYVLKNGNVISEEMLYYLNDKLYGKINVAYTYDDKNNVFKNVLGFDKAKMYLLYELGVNMIGNNNLLTKEHMNRPVTGGISKYKVINDISYSSSNYPVQIISKQYGANDQLQGTETDFFEYNK